jgi:carboxyl-terminal processing protease
MRLHRAVITFSVAVLLAGATAGLLTTSRTDVSRSEPRWLALLTPERALAAEEPAPVAAYLEALSILKRDYYPTRITPAKTRELTYSAIRGMLFALNDPYTGFLEPVDYKEMEEQTSGTFDGIGAELQKTNEEVTIARPLPNSPALKAGLKAGDVIVSVGTHDPVTGKLVKTTSMIGKETTDAVRLIRGPRGTKVTLNITRAGSMQPLTFTIVRSQIEPMYIRYWMEDEQEKIGRIVLTEFSLTSVPQFDKAYQDLQKQGLRALILDLRYNPGGRLDVAVDIASRFIERGPVVLIQESNGKRHELRAKSVRNRVTGVPIVVLINENSASASEIVAGAIQDLNLGTLIGQHTFGKGLVQTVSRLPDGSALKLTTAKYLLPSGRDINNRFDEEHKPIPNSGGVKPDIEVKQSDDWPELNFEEKKTDTQLQKALSELRVKLASARKVAKN